jgi:hypothetical protein
MKKPKPTTAAWSAVVLMTASLSAMALGAEAATPAWRCGNTYTDQPCQGGKPLAAEDERSATQKREAETITREAKATADRLERERMSVESAQTRQPALIDNKPRDKPTPAQSTTGASSPKKKKKKKSALEQDHFSARDPIATTGNKAAKNSRKSVAKS